MKRTISILSVLCLTLAFAKAQTIDDAMNFAENDYYGTARTMSLGGAMTALGSDLGSFVFNPAGSAVAKYSQVSITPGVSISSVNAYFDNRSGSRDKINQARFIVPNIGATLRFDTGRISGVKAVTVGFVTHMTNNFNRSFASGAQTPTSYAGYLADYASTAYDRIEKVYGYTAERLRRSEWDINVDWNCKLGDETGMIHNAPGALPRFWTGVTEDYIGYNGTNKPHQVYTDYSQRSYGSKLDYVINIGVNISDVVFLGANLGLQTYRYSYEDYLSEGKVREELYTSRFNRLSSEYVYNCSGNGVYGKFGILVTPFAGLRIGAAFTTPTVMNIAEDWQTTMSVITDIDSSGDRTTGLNRHTPVAENRYRFVSPMRFNMGLAYTFGKYAIASVDYELVNYGRSEFRRASGWSNDFTDLNREIKGTAPTDEFDYDFLGRQHMLRAGLELKPVQWLAVRLGYGLSTSGRCYYENGRPFNLKANTNSYSFGFGYDPQSSFFMDIACRLKQCPEQYTLLYGHYLYDCDSPIVTSKQLLTTIVATVGWRF